MKRWVLIFILSVSGLHCVSSPSRVENAARLPQVIFVPGYYGSTLIREADEKTIWFTAGQALWGDQTLALDVAGLRIPGATAFRVGEVFRSLSFLGFPNDVYGSVLDGLQRGLAGRARVVGFAYDWRQDIAQSARRLGALVEDLYAQGAPSVAVVAHSMGGLVTAYYLLYGDQSLENSRMNLAGARRLHAVAMAAAPFQGTLAVFRNMQHGIAFGLNAKALEGLAVSSFPSSYQILPQYPQALLSEDGRDLSDWILDGERWREYDWSLLKDAQQLDAATRTNRAEYTHAMLTAARRFYEKIHAPVGESKSGLPFLYYWSDAMPTDHRALWHATKRELLFAGKNIPEERLRRPNAAPLLLPGDGTVTEVSAMPPENFAAIFPALQMRKRPQEHLQLLKDTENSNAILEFLQETLELPDA